MFLQAIRVVAANSSTSEDISIPAEAPSGIYRIQFSDQYSGVNINASVYSQGFDSTLYKPLETLYNCNRSIVNDRNGSGIGILYWNYNSETRVSEAVLPQMSEYWNVCAFALHTTGSPTKVLVLTNASSSWDLDPYITDVVIQQIAQ